MGASQTLRRGTINQTLCSVGLGVSYKKRCNIQRPAYSPDLNPIEHKWAPAKAIRRQYRCGVDELFSEHSQYVVL